MACPNSSSCSESSSRTISGGGLRDLLARSSEKDNLKELKVEELFLIQAFNSEI